MRESTINNPAVYCGTYAKYNDGSLFGAWMYPADYDSLEDFYEACKQLHKDEADPEFMFQDCDYVPKDLYSEYGVSENLFNFCKAVEDMDELTAEAYTAYVECFDNIDVDEFNEAYYCEDMNDYDFGYMLVEESGLLNDVPESVANYFDYAAYGRDCKFDFTEYNGFIFWN